MSKKINEKCLKRALLLVQERQSLLDVLPKVERVRESNRLAIDIVSEDYPIAVVSRTLCTLTHSLFVDTALDTVRIRIKDIENELDELGVDYSGETD